MSTLYICLFYTPHCPQLNDLPAAKALVAFGCEVNSLNPDDKTPLDIARRCHPDGDIVTLLVSVGGQTGR